MRVRRWLVLISLFLVAGIGIYFYSHYRRARQERRAEFARLSTANFFLAGPYHSAATVTVTATVTSTATSTATSASIASWGSARYPAFAQVTQKYGTAIERVRYLAAQKAFVAAPGSAPAERVELAERFVQTITTADGMQVNQMFDQRTGELTSERWQDPLLGEVRKVYHPEQESVSLGTESAKLKIEFIPTPRDGGEYLAVQEADQGFVSNLEGGRRLEYWADLKKNRFVEYQNGQPSRQWRRMGENRFQEIDERGQGLSFYRVNQEDGGIELAE